MSREITGGVVDGTRDFGRTFANSIATRLQISVIYMGLGSVEGAAGKFADVF